MASAGGSLTTNCRQRPRFAACLPWRCGFTEVGAVVRYAALSDGLLASIDEWRFLSLDTSANAWVFPSERLTTPLAKDNCWRRSFLPRLTPIGLAWANFQVMRRTHSSLLKKLDVDPHVRAEQMGHTVDVNENVYTITSLKRRKEAVNALERAIGA